MDSWLDLGPAALVAAVVAAIVTLVVEYLAKPALEVRKDRILERDRTVRELRQDLARLSTIAMVAATHVRPHGMTADRALIELENYQRVLHNVLDNPDGMAELPSEVRAKLMYGLGWADTMSAAAIKSFDEDSDLDTERCVTELEEEYRTHLGPVVDYILTPKQRFIARWLQRQAIRQQQTADEELE